MFALLKMNRMGGGTLCHATRRKKNSLFAIITLLNKRKISLFDTAFVMPEVSIQIENKGMAPNAPPPQIFSIFSQVFYLNMIRVKD